MSEILIQRAVASQETRRPSQDLSERPVSSGEPSGGTGGTARSGLLDLAAMPAERPAVYRDAAAIEAAERVHEGLSAYYRDDLDAESVRKLALLVKQQLSIQTLSIVNAHALGLLSMMRDIELM